MEIVGLHHVIVHDTDASYARMSYEDDNMDDGEGDGDEDDKEDNNVGCLPIPAAARYIAHGEPSPPAPTISADVFLSASCPCIPISGISSCRLYCAISDFDRCVALAVVVVVVLFAGWLSLEVESEVGNFPTAGSWWWVSWR